MDREEQMLKDISVLNFVLVDLMLFLDTHPEDRGALEYYNHYLPIKEEMCREFASDFYPLTREMADSNGSFRWQNAPLPWEGGCK